MLRRKAPLEADYISPQRGNLWVYYLKFDFWIFVNIELINITTMNPTRLCGECDNATVAAALGHLDCLKKAHLNGCKWDASVCSWAAMKGHLDCLAYAHENGCPWNAWACGYATQHGQLKCLKYLHANGCPCSHNIDKLEIYSPELDTTTDNGDIQCGICYTNCTRVEFKPCNHKLCISCSNTIITQNPQKKCPFCRGNVEKTLLLLDKKFKQVFVVIMVIMVLASLLLLGYIFYASLTYHA